MSTTEIAVRRSQASAIPAKLAYAQELANSGLLPAAYRRNPANVLWAVEYGEMLGLPPMAAMTGVHVIEGKPSASAGLISGLVRQAGHRLRVWGDNKSATCEITRSDDPEHPFSVTWTLKKEPGDNPSAEVAGLLNKGTWKNYPSAMLKSRAITQCARDACEEVLFGLHYTPEELGAEVDEDGAVVPGGVRWPAAEVPAEDPSPEQEWLAKAMETAANHASLDACAVVWRRSSELVHDGKLTRDEAGRLQDVLRKRMEELKNAPPAAETPAEEVVEAEIVEDGEPGLDPEDPWLPAIKELGSAEEAEILLADLIDQRGKGQIDPERAALLEQAIERSVEARFPAEAKAAA